ncbi:MAG: YbaB/EbfC family nucleoid-associated protein [Thermotogaceae bacterium]|nr:YbaB/EbfC family nucleoid-associated protein [Thermotogaceae bacterium]
MKRIRGFGGKSYGGNKPEKMIKDLQKMQEEMSERLKKLEEDFEQTEVEASAGGGAVTVRAKCNYEITSIEYDSDLLEDSEMFNDLLIAAVNEVLREISKKREEETQKITGSLQTPFGL